MPPNPKPSPKSTTNRRQQIRNLVQRLLNAIFGLLRLLEKCLIWIFRCLLSPLQKAKRGDRILAVILLLIWIGIILSNFYFRGRYIFEGNLIVKEMSFTYTGDIEKLFLNTISGIKNLDIEGSQPQPLTLTGKFSSANPDLNQKLSQRNKLTIELPYPTSRLIFTPGNPSKASEISILELRINPETQVNQLAYNSQYNQLSFCLQSASKPLESCLFPDSLLDNPAQSNSETVGSLQLQLGQQPLTISLGMFNIPELGIKTDIYAPEDLTFQFIPEFDEPLLTILSPTRLLIGLPDSSKPENSETANIPQWLRGDIDVAGVSFTRFDITEKVTDELKNSTIVQGEVRMGSKVIKLQKNQFLVVLSDKPGIRKLRYIQIYRQQPQGLQTFISGESTGIAVGLYPEFPVESIEPSWLSKYFSQEAVNALLAFIAALTAVFLPRLFPESSEKTDSSQKN